jgi:aspartyl protease family protein
MIEGDDWGRLAYLGLILLALMGWVIVEYKSRLGFAVRSAAAWFMIFVGVAAGYGMWQDMQGRIMPLQEVSGGAVELPRARDGHYYATLTINGTEIEFLADTGASELVLSADDADRLGIDRSTLRYLGEAQTANGVVRTARVALPLVEFGPFRDTDVVAYVTDGDMGGSLLGMSYLGRFRIEIAERRMILSR